MVSINNITSVEKDRVLIAGKRLPVSETYKKDFLALIGAGK
jgi:hypothetical protein